MKAIDSKGTPFLDILIDCEQKNVISDPAVQKYLSDVWVGNLKWSDARFILLFFSFVFLPFLWIFFSLPIDARLNRVPIIKFIVYLVSHIYLVILFIITCAMPLQPIYEADLLPQWNEWLLLIWVLGVFVNETTKPTDRTGIGWVRILILILCAISVVVHLIGFAFEKHSEIIYIRNMFLSAAMTLCFVQFLEFLSFHYLFGPWSIIIEGLLKDLFKFGVIVLMFMVAFTMWLAAVYQPVFTCGVAPQNRTCTFTPIVDNGVNESAGHIQHPGYTFQLFFFALFGLVEPDLLPPTEQSPVYSIYLVQIVFGLFNIIMLIVLINLLIAMMSDTYQRIEAQSDTEWKFGRAKLIRNMKKTTLSPSPLNLPVTLFHYIRLCYRNKGRVCDPEVTFDGRIDDLESIPDSRSPDALINQRWRFKKGKSAIVSPSATPLPPIHTNTRTSLNRQKSLQDIVSWNTIRHRFWAAKGRDILAEAEGEGVGYSVVSEKNSHNSKYEEDKPNGGFHGYQNGGANISSFNLTSDDQMPLPGGVFDGSPLQSRKSPD